MRIIIKLLSSPILFLILIVIISQYYLLHDTLTLGFKPDDWILYISYKLLGSNSLAKISSVWAERGLYTTYQVYYIGLLDSLFGLNYNLFHWANLTFKMAATVSLYPLVRLISKNSLLAFLSVIFFAVSHTTVGPLEFVVKGSDDIAIFWMNLFLIVYYLIISDKLAGFKHHLLLLALFILSIALSPIRLFPLLVIPPIIEIFLMINNFNADSFKKSLIRLLVLYSIFILFYFSTTAVSLYGNAYGPVGIFKKIAEGNWYMLLMPFSGIGYTFVTDDYWDAMFGTIDADTLNSYLFFLLGGPTIICGILTALLAWSLIKKHKMLFFISTLFSNFLFQVLIYFIAFNHRNLPNIKNDFDTTIIYSVIFGAYVVIIGLAVFISWLKRETDFGLAAPFWMGSFFVFIFTSLTWVFAPLGTLFSSTSYYLVVASVGSAIMLAAFLVSIFNKLKDFFYNRPILGKFGFLIYILFLSLIPIFAMSSREIRQKFILLNKDGLGVSGQIIMQTEARRVIRDFKQGDQALVFFDTSDITGFGPFYSEGFLTSFPYFMLLKDDKIIEGCIGIIYEDNKMIELRKSVNAQNGIKGFNYRALCVNRGKSDISNLFFSSDQFYAFKIENRKLVDIKESVLDQLSFKENE